MLLRNVDIFYVHGVRDQMTVLFLATALVTSNPKSPVKSSYIPDSHLASLLGSEVIPDVCNLHNMMRAGSTPTLNLRGRAILESWSE
jgi:hypothetical protein